MATSDVEMGSCDEQEWSESSVVNLDSDTESECEPEEEEEKKKLRRSPRKNTGKRFAQCIKCKRFTMPAEASAIHTFPIYHAKCIVCGFKVRSSYPHMYTKHSKIYSPQ